MRFLRVGAPGQEKPVLLHDERHYSLETLTDDLDGEFWAAGPPRALAALAAGELEEISIEGLRTGPPIARPGAVVCIGQNYAAHAAESGSPVPEQPIVFFKTPNTIAGPNDPVGIPPRAVTTDWEVELGIVIGKRAEYLPSPASAAEHIAGYVLANDLSERTYQLEESGGQWSKGKCIRGFCPLGPFLVTPDEIDVQDLALRSWVNGEPRQDSSTADMIFDVTYLVHHLSRYMQLEPGDLILTGTPQGVALSGRFPYLRGGDVVEMEITGLGRQRQQYTQL